MNFPDATKPSEFIEAVRSVFRAYVPESDGWAKPNFFGVFSTIIGKLFWSAINEARNGVDARMNPQTAVGENLDLIAAMPPLNLKRLTPTQAVGFVEVNFPTLLNIPQGYQFTSESGTVYTVDALSANVGLVPVTSQEYGADTNSFENQPLTSVDGTSFSRGIYGGSDTECDEQFRRRIFAERSKFHFFGSACSYETAMLGFPDVSRAWAVEGNSRARLLFLMEGKYPCGEPLQSDIDAITAYFQDECLSNMFFCPNFEGAESLTLAPSITWRAGPVDDYCEVEQAMTDWLRANFDLGENVKPCDIQRFLDNNYPEFEPHVNCCDEYIAECDQVYNCVQLLHGCG